MSVLLCLSCAWLLGPLCTLAHELGHASTVLRSATGPVHVTVGSGKRAVRLRTRRLRISLSLYGLGGCCHYRTDEMTRRQHARRALAGPAMNLGLALLLLPVTAGSHGSVHIALLTALTMNAVMGVGNLLPARSPFTMNAGVASDGLQAWSSLRGRPLWAQLDG